MVTNRPLPRDSVWTAVYSIAFLTIETRIAERFKHSFSVGVNPGIRLCHLSANGYGSARTLNRKDAPLLTLTDCVTIESEPVTPDPISVQGPDRFPVCK